MYSNNSTWENKVYIYLPMPKNISNDLTNELLQYTFDIMLNEYTNRIIADYSQTLASLDSYLSCDPQISVLKIDENSITTDITNESVLNVSHTTPTPTFMISNTTPTITTTQTYWNILIRKFLIMNVLSNENWDQFIINNPIFYAEVHLLFYYIKT